MINFSENDLEETLKIKVHEYFFSKYRYSQIGRVDFAISNADSLQFDLFNNDYTFYYLWAEAKRNSKSNLYESFVQLILTIGKEKTFNNNLPPLFLGAFDNEKIAFIPYTIIQDILIQNDFNWKVTPSDHDTKEFRQIYDLVNNEIQNNSLIFNFQKDEQELKTFIKKNFVIGKRNVNLIEITKNNFTSIYFRWLDVVKHTINIKWDVIKKYGIIDADFYLADLLSEGDVSVKDSLFVLLKSNHYEFARSTDELGNCVRTASFNDEQSAYKRFWSVYKRPPRKIFWKYIVERRDLLVPQDIREIKGSYFTPKIWVEKSQEYISKALGDDWQDNYYIWDCCAGTGNLLNGLTNKFNIWASTIDQQDVDVMKDRIKNGANLLDSHVFQFDFLNDDFNDPKVPNSLKEILTNDEKRKRLFIYINPPYAEADSRIGKGRSKFAISKIHKKYEPFMGYSKRELYIQFLTRIYKEIPNCRLGLFSKLKHIQAPRFKCFRDNFNAELSKLFMVPANTFDNVSGSFPIAFQLWDLNRHTNNQNLLADVIDDKNVFLGKKHIKSYTGSELINEWVKTFRGDKNVANSIGTVIAIASDFQNQRTVRIEKPYQQVKADNHNWQITFDNILQSCVYMAVRLIPKSTWVNDRDNFLYPSIDVSKDTDFCNNCLIYMLFHSQNKITIKDGDNYWLPFKEQDVNAKDVYKFQDMSNFISNLCLSPTALDVMNCAKEIYKYYYSKKDSYNDVSFYDIKYYFQKSDNGRMNTKSNDKIYESLHNKLKQSLIALSYLIEPKIYQYGFLIK